MHDVVLVRHAESEAAARKTVGGDAPLTERGRLQARELGRTLAPSPFDLCMTSASARARETASLLLEAREVPCEVVPELGDVDFGAFDGRPLDEYRAWVGGHPPDERPPGGESRVETLRRFCGAYRRVLERPERHVLVVAHGLTLSALLDERPRPVVAGVPYAACVRLTGDELAQAVARVERWCDAPAW
jgi:broad specificity phosphatase PhoE